VLGVVVFVALAFFVTCALGLSIPADISRYVDEHAGWVLLIAGLQAAVTTSRRRRGLEAACRDSWVAITPRAAVTTRFTVALGVVWSVLWQLAVALAVLAALALLTPHAELSHAIGALLGGAAVGALLGAWFSKLSRKARAPGSRYLPKSFEKRRVTRALDLRVLAHWPIASALAAADPQTLRWPAMAAMLSVMAGSSMATGLGVVGFWMLMLYMILLYRATLRTAHDAAEWLRSTPLGFSRFAVAVGTRSLIHQSIAGLLMGSYLLTEHLTPFDALYVASLWIAFVLVAYTTSMAYSYSSRRGTRFAIAVAAVVIAALESFQRGTALPTAVLVSAWQWRRTGARG
jgi:hypothetical protein